VSADGGRFAISAAATRALADEIATRFAPRATVLAIRPRWSFPARDWVDADPAFWGSVLRE